jgi:hypothetical protein
MSALDHAAVEVPGPALAARRHRSPRLTPARAAVAFAVAQLPLAVVAIALEWRGSWAVPEEPGPIVADVLQSGSAISGPLLPQVIFALLALVATRARGRWNVVATAGIGVMGLLVTFNGAMSGLTEAEHAPQAAAAAAAVGFVAAGLTLVGLSARDLTRRRPTT